MRSSVTARTTVTNTAVSSAPVAAYAVVPTWVEDFREDVAAVRDSGKPTLILWDVADQPIWATQVKRLKLGASRRFSNAKLRTLVDDLRIVLAPECERRALALAAQMSEPGDAVAKAADLLASSVQSRPSDDAKSATKG